MALSSGRGETKYEGVLAKYGQQLGCGRRTSLLSVATEAVVVDTNGYSASLVRLVARVLLDIRHWPVHLFVVLANKHNDFRSPAHPRQ